MLSFSATSLQRGKVRKNRCFAYSERIFPLKCTLLVNDYPQFVDEYNELAWTYMLSGILYQDQGRLSEALSAYMATSEILNELDESGLAYDRDLLDCAVENGNELMRFMAMNGAFSSEIDGKEIDWNHVQFLFPGQSMDGILGPIEEQEDADSKS